MHTQRTPWLVFLFLLLLLLTLPPSAHKVAASPATDRPLADDPSPPSSSVKLIFVHHSTGGNWLADLDVHEYAGGLGRALMSNNYYVSATNYGWEVNGDAIGDRTDIGHWWEWFRGPNSAAIMSALYRENGQHIQDGWWPRGADPGGENEIIMFKSCFPNSHLGGHPNDPPTTGDNPLRGQDAWSEYMTVANAKGIYNDILAYFRTRQDKLFIVITTPPLHQSETDAAHAANARAFNSWLVNDWLSDYPYPNVAVFDFYNVLTSNGGSTTVNDLNLTTGNHHRWYGGTIQHVHPVNNNFSAYAQAGDSHPLSAGGQKATGEFVPLLNIYYHRWRGTKPRPDEYADGDPVAAHGYGDGTACHGDLDANHFRRSGHSDTDTNRHAHARHGDTRDRPPAGRLARRLLRRLPRRLDLVGGAGRERWRAGESRDLLGGRSTSPQPVVV